MAIGNRGYHPSYGGDTSKIFVAGMSAGSYLSTMDGHSLYIEGDVEIERIEIAKVK